MPDYSGMTLAEIAVGLPTDKLGHGFLDFYELVLAPMRATATKVMEIGVGTGGSLTLWSRYFPKATVWGVDSLYKPPFEPETDRIVCVQHNQEDVAGWPKVIEKTGTDFDFIIDDGSHRMSHQQTSFEYLVQCVRPGGFYIIEDLHTSFSDPDSMRRYGAGEGGETLWFLTKWFETGNFPGPHISCSPGCVARAAIFGTRQNLTAVMWKRH